MSLKVLSILFPLALSTNLMAKTYSAFLGVGGEAAGPTTMFDSEVSDMGKLSQSIGGEVIVSLNGGHTKTEEIIKKQFKPENKPFVEANFEQIISDYEKKIHSGEIKTNDQLMLLINSHGAEKQSDEKTHRISLAGAEIKDLDTGAGARNISMDRLEALAKLAEQKGVKLAILDLSCHSGNSMVLGNSKTCVITASGPNHYSYGGNFLTFPRRLFKHMKKGATLEEAFLKARAASWDLAFPMISTPVGLELNKDLYKPLTPFLFYTDNGGGDKLTPYIRREAEKCVNCESSEQLDALKGLISEAQAFQTIAKNAKFSAKEATRLDQALQEYAAVQKQLRDGLAALDVPELTKEEKFCSDTIRESYEVENYKIKVVKKTVPQCSSYTVKQILYGDFTWASGYYKKNANADLSDFYGAEYKNIEKVLARKEELKKAYPDIPKWETYFQDNSKLTKKTYSLAQEVAFASQHLYEALYNQKRSQEKDSNPCKDFVL